MLRKLTAALLLCLLPTLLWAATSNVYTVRGTPITFKDSTGTYAINIAGAAAGKGSWSAQADLGASPQPSVYGWECNVRMQTNGVLGEHVDFYLAPGDGTDIAGAPLITSSAGSLDTLTVTTQLPNLIFLGSVYVDVSDSTKSQSSFGMITVWTRYASLVYFNSTTKQLTTTATTANVNYCSLTPLYFQAQ